MNLCYALKETRAMKVSVFIHKLLSSDSIKFMDCPFKLVGRGVVKSDCVIFFLGQSSAKTHFSVFANTIFVTLWRAISFAWIDHAIFLQFFVPPPPKKIEQIKRSVPY